jgi:type IV secretory pathway TrbD component
MRNVAIPLPKSIWKPKLLMGTEPLPFTLFFVTAGIIVYEADTWYKLVGVGYFLIMIGISAYCNSTDPLFFKGLVRFLEHQDFYPNSSMHPSSDYKVRNF